MKAYLRPSELLMAQVQDVGLPIPSQDLGQVTLRVAPLEGGVPAKTGTYDDTVVVDEPVWLGQQVVSIVKTRGQEELLFQMSGKEFQRVWELVCNDLGIIAHSYQLRHSGACDDSLSQRRTLLEIQARGRWECARTMRRYTKPGQLQSSWQRLSPEIQEYCELCQEHLEGVVCNTIQGPLLPARKVRAVNLVR